jgi:hypothetical protein
MFQTPVFANDLDTPELFHLSPPPNFFLYWNHSSFDRTNFPPVPDVDHRLLSPDDSVKEWVTHRGVATKYLAKHGIVPSFVPHVSHAVNMSVVYNGVFDRRLRRDLEDPAIPAPPRPPVEELNARNFWFTAHCGNFIELFETQDAPAVFLHESSEDRSGGAQLYTLMVASPDYPYATAPNISTSGFFLNYVVSNLKAGAPGAAATGGEVVVPYVHPLPTEDGGTVRVMCMLFRQKTRVEGIRPLDPTELLSAFPHPLRSQYRLHQYLANPALGDAVAGYFKLPAVEKSLDGIHPVALTFYRTTWDIQVQEHYEAIGVPEPAYQHDEELEAILQYNATPSAQLRVRARHTPDGAKNPGNDPIFWQQSEPTVTADGTMSKLWSRRTQLGANGKRIVTASQRKP